MNQTSSNGFGPPSGKVEPPLSLLCELTYRCPLQCPYCSNPVGFARTGAELSTEEWKHTLSQAAQLGVVQAHFSGGEPLVRHDLVELVEHAHQQGLYINLSTGGTLLTRSLVASLKQAGLDSIQLSLQGADPTLSDEMSGSKGSFSKKIEVAHWIHEVGLPLTLNVVLHRRNIDQLEAILVLAEQLHAERLELANTQYYGWALLNRASLLPTRLQLERAHATLARTRERLRDKMEILWVLPDYYETYPKPCLGGWAQRFLTVTPDGLALPCQVARQLPMLVFPNVKEKTLEEIWFHSEAFQKFRGVEWMPEPCRSCPRRFIDFGGCRCQAYLLTGDPARTDPVCMYSPDHWLIEKAVEEAQENGEKTLTYRTRGASRRLTANQPVGVAGGVWEKLGSG
ncbi:pyrroloquinoline quinone biosynthesis protein PqqE [Candidatus Methylacidithermus pantelleriae]|uniref:PqqA peptide cyclase n=1 Tax=Candidatus Methylacidithermus pantelleriae TaxID=2744239 RepID=A0A8J2BTE4_9BACT|nr:pyrroloquinoline quinone biosynthesis protein PqqE [Candidatus Methylacidithermus pantelleriae]CAF0697557.1 PqqA peptide cyclase [Candidatus Methylacidithermus pantelleriae]